MRIQHRAVVSSVVVVALTAFAVSSVVARGQTQGATAEPQRSFDVASIKEVDDQTPLGGGISFPPGRITIRNIPLSSIIEFAYGLTPRSYHLVGAPDWVSYTRYQINATYSGEPALSAQVWPMVQQLLKDRFRLVSHRETRQGDVYALVLARSDGTFGPRLKRSDIDCAKWRAENRPLVGGGGPSPVAPGGRRPQCLMLQNARSISGGAISMQELAKGLDNAVRAPVVDRTGLSGVFDVDLQYTLSWELTASPDATTSIPSDGVSIFTAVQEQLGLKLQADRGPIEVMVIDSVKRPTPN